MSLALAHDLTVIVVFSSALSYRGDLKEVVLLLLRGVSMTDSCCGEMEAVPSTSD